VLVLVQLVLFLGSPMSHSVCAHTNVSTGIGHLWRSGAGSGTDTTDK
jgi:hypothetical protein